MSLMALPPELRQEIFRHALPSLIVILRGPRRRLDKAYCLDLLVVSRAIREDALDVFKKFVELSFHWRFEPRSWSYRIPDTFQSLRNITLTFEVHRVLGGGTPAEEAFGAFHDIARLNVYRVLAPKDPVTLNMRWNSSCEPSSVALERVRNFATDVDDLLRHHRRFPIKIRFTEIVDHGADILRENVIFDLPIAEMLDLDLDKYRFFGPPRWALYRDQWY